MRETKEHPMGDTPDTTPEQSTEVSVEAENVTVNTGDGGGDTENEAPAAQSDED